MCGALNKLCYITVETLSSSVSQDPVLELIQFLLELVNTFLSPGRPGGEFS